MPDIALVQALEERSFNAWPARQTVLHGGWQFRLAGGFTKRANSANATLAGAAFAGVRSAAEALYARQGLPAIFRISPLAAPQADAELAQAGYTLADPSLVLRAPLDCAAADADVEVAATSSDAWLDGLAIANGVPQEQHPAHHAMVRRIALPAGFATLRLQGEAVAFGLGVVERGAIGLYDLVVAPAHRGQGHGRRLVRALAHWGRQSNAGWVYLQVSEQNTAARTLYTALGFAPC